MIQTIAFYTLIGLLSYCIGDVTAEYIYKELKESQIERNKQDK